MRVTDAHDTRPQGTDRSVAPPRRTVHVDSVDLLRVHPWLDLFSAVAPALRPSRLWIAFVTLLLIAGFGRVWDGLGTLHPFDSLSRGIRQGFLSCVAGVVSLDPRAAMAGLHDTLWTTPVDSWHHERLFTVCFALVALAIFGLGAGMLSRHFAGEIAGNSWSVAEVRRYVRERRVALLAAPLLGGLIGGALVLVLLISGVLFHIPLFNVIAGALGGLWLLLAGLAIIVWGCILVGYPLLAPAVACDGCDGIESVQRAGAYSLARPFLYAWLLLVSVVILALVAAVADGVATGAWRLAISALSAGLPPETLASAGQLSWLTPASPAPPHGGALTDGATASLLDMWRTVLRLLVGAAILSTAVSLATRIYLVLRRSCDGQDQTDIWEDVKSSPPSA